MQFDPSLIQKAREAAGLSRDELAVQAGCSAVSLWRVESGKQVPSADLVGALADALGVDVNTFYVEPEGEQESREAAHPQQEDGGPSKPKEDTR